MDQGRASTYQNLARIGKSRGFRQGYGRCLSRPAFVGLGAPYWDSQARGAFLGITRGTTRAHLVRAALESLAYQSRDLVEAMLKDSHLKLKELRVDGGACKNNLLMQFQADLLNIKINRPEVVETTARGVAYLAGLQAGVWKSTRELQHLRQVDRVFRPKMKEQERQRLWSGWKWAVGQVLSR